MVHSSRGASPRSGAMLRATSGTKRPVASSTDREIVGDQTYCGQPMRPSDRHPLSERTCSRLTHLKTPRRIRTSRHSKVDDEGGVGLVNSSHAPFPRRSTAVTCELVGVRGVHHSLRLFGRRPPPPSAREQFGARAPGSPVDAATDRFDLWQFRHAHPW